MNNQAETPMSDHIRSFWEILATEHVRILIDIRRDHDEGQPPHWDSTSFPNDVAKALIADRRASVEACARIVERWSLPTIQTPSMWLVDQTGIAAEIRGIAKIDGEVVTDDDGNWVEIRKLTPAVQKD